MKKKTEQKLTEPKSNAHTQATARLRPVVPRPLSERCDRVAVVRVGGLVGAGRVRRRAMAADDSELTDTVEEDMRVDDEAPLLRETEARTSEVV